MVIYNIHMYCGNKYYFIAYFKSQGFFFIELGIDFRDENKQYAFAPSSLNLVKCESLYD